MNPFEAILLELDTLRVRLRRDGTAAATREELAEVVAQVPAGMMIRYRAWAEARGEDAWLRESGNLLVSAAPAQDAALEDAVAILAGTAGTTVSPGGKAQDARPLSAADRWPARPRDRERRDRERSQIARRHARPRLAAFRTHYRAGRDYPG